MSAATLSTITIGQRLAWVGEDPIDGTVIHADRYSVTVKWDDDQTVTYNREDYWTWEEISPVEDMPF